MAGETPAEPTVIDARFDALRLVTRDVVHDANNLLMAVSGYVTLALIDLPSGSPARDAVERAESAARAAAGLLRQLMELSSEDPAEAGPSDVAAALTGIAGLLDVAAGPGRELRMELSGPLPQAAFPRRALQRATVFLVLAGRDLTGYVRDPLALRVTRRGDDRLAIGLGSTGADVTNGESDADGNGSGVVHGPVDEHGPGDEHGRGEAGGRPAVDRGPGEAALRDRVDLLLAGITAEIAAHGGTVERGGAPAPIEILVPVATDTEGGHGQAPAAGLPAAWPAGRPPVVLVADDEEPVRRVAGRLLESIGCEIELVEGGTRAVERFRADPGRFDAVLLDLSMPDLEGTEALERVSEIRPDVALILMSGYAPGNLAARLRARSVTFLQKPFSRTSLLEALEASLSSRRGT